jgi:hypothetical protein
MTSGWRPTDSQLALSTKFIPLLYSVLQPVLESKTQSRQFFVGDQIKISKFNNGNVAGIISVIPPGKEDASIKVGDVFLPDKPGLYKVMGTDWSDIFAVNILPSESRTEPISMDQFQKLGLPMNDLAATPEQLASSVAKEKTEAQRHEYWQWALAAMLLFVIIETFLAAKGSRTGELITAS